VNHDAPTNLILGTHSDGVADPTQGLDANATGADLRVAVAYGAKEYGNLRVSVITSADAEAPVLTVDGDTVDWQYSAPFK
jgi:hypothetical protein